MLTTQKVRRDLYHGFTIYRNPPMHHDLSSSVHAAKLFICDLPIPVDHLPNDETFGVHVQMHSLEAIFYG